MTEAPDIDNAGSPTTDGEIAAINLESVRRRSWDRFFQDPLQHGVAESVIEHEQLTAQFPGDVFALDRLQHLVQELVQLDAASARTALIQAQIASMAHRFADARHYLAQAEIGGAPKVDVQALLLNIDQACGINLDSVLDARRRTADEFNRLEDVVVLGSLLADMRAFADADRAYRQALRDYRDVSPFPVARVCFDLGVLWGELVPKTERTHATDWYRRAIDVLPSYAK